MQELLRNILSVTGLFIPYRTEWLGEERKEWVFTLSVGHVPLGWVMIAVALAVKYI